MASGMLSVELKNRQMVQGIYCEHHGWLRSWLIKKLGCQHHAADLAQDTFVRLMSSERLPQPEQSRAYLTQIAKGLMIDLHRRHLLEQAYYEAVAQLPEPQVPSLETRAILLETLMSIDAALSTLPAKVRETFLLSQFDGYTYSQIAAMQGISVAAVRKYMLKAAHACLLALG